MQLHSDDKKTYARCTYMRPSYADNGMPKKLELDQKLMHRSGFNVYDENGVLKSRGIGDWQDYTV